MSSAQLEYLNQDVWKDGIFDNKVVFCTGGSGSICSAQVRALVHLGANACIIGRNVEKTRRMAANIATTRLGAEVMVSLQSMCATSKTCKLQRGQCARDLGGIDFVTNYVRYLSSSSKDYSIFEVNLIDTKPVPQSQNQSSPTTESLTLQISVDGSKVVAHCVTPSPDPGSLDHAQTIYCHFSHLGTWKSCRAAVEVKSDAQKDMVAPMPCKVLSVQKDRGDKVEVGDVVMVVESMKMEVSLKASGAGQFQTQWKAGDAVNEGQVLYQVV
ncbi:hypothetical protein FOZG_17647 [Fusarium oxysporum Fo47]|uniref:Lipoyl-binding domain-containing protein n=1 Tax=Fusarium oxysporum Fo47 TaxID=660027 RepID=W9J9B3_FUSOX|nr:hypothetical protein FOZG_17647 [Fusarium oxysporum Fo47]